MNLKLEKLFPSSSEKKGSAKKILSEEASPLLVDKDLRNIANVIYKSLQGEGCESKQIISVSSELLNLVTLELEAKK
jgi:hypothetical protein